MATNRSRPNRNSRLSRRNHHPDPHNPLTAVRIDTPSFPPPNPRWNDAANQEYRNHGGTHSAKYNSKIRNKCDGLFDDRIAVSIFRRLNCSSDALVVSIVTGWRFLGIGHTRIAMQVSCAMASRQPRVRLDLLRLVLGRPRFCPLRAGSDPGRSI
ncbi:hypothetical protein GCM10010435_95500 [Winogradskya consettensis]|uniref:Uncharacterized protein n=1 Tax=Winogradskya consettensis TaxID=113560 RepID=A0A919VZ42_9ACTN|nr:hypothetical protein Aco04nite_90970 [Actinoplanes consettensis]